MTSASWFGWTTASTAVPVPRLGLQDNVREVARKESESEFAAVGYVVGGAAVGRGGAVPVKREGGIAKNACSPRAGTRRLACSRALLDDFEARMPLADARVLLGRRPEGNMM